MVYPPVHVIWSEHFQTQERKSRQWRAFLDFLHMSIVQKIIFNCCPTRGHQCLCKAWCIWSLWPIKVGLYSIHCTHTHVIVDSNPQHLMVYVCSSYQKSSCCFRMSMHSSQTQGPPSPGQRFQVKPDKMLRVRQIVSGTVARCMKIGEPVGLIWRLARIWHPDTHYTLDTKIRLQAKEQSIRILQIFLLPVISLKKRTPGQHPKPLGLYWFCLEFLIWNFWLVLRWLSSPSNIVPS
jgi:hypothetical protein